MRVQILGRVRAWREQTELDLGGPQQRAVLALLAITRGQVATRSELVEALWSGRPPSTAVNMVQIYVQRLRRLFEPDRRTRAPSQVLPSVGTGYALHLPPGGLDLSRFRELVRSAARAQTDGDPRLAAEWLAAAVGLWHDAPLADLAFLADHPRVVALAGERWAATARYGEAMIAVGAAVDVLPALYEAATAQPLDEAAHALLIRAYHAAGQREQAFTTYDAMRRRLADELGIDPGPELVSAHAALLAPDRPDRTVATAEPSAPPAVVPAQLPAPLAAFTGRTEPLHRLDKLVAGTPEAPTVTISTIAGAAGIGKTALAVYWAHQIADRFPDGQLFVNLRGLDPGGQAMTPADAIHGFLDALRVPPQHVPTSLEAQVGLYRSLLAGRRMLILLDNARDPDQVRPLLPGTPGSLVLVTSRYQLTGLVASDDAHPVTLDLLPGPEARQLLERRLGTERLAAEPDAVDQIVHRCAGLPLALALVAARAVIRPERDLGAIAGELHGGLDGFATGERTTDLRAVFSWSYQALGTEAQRLFRLLAVHPGPDLAAPAAASLAGVPAGQVTPLLAELARAHLVNEALPGRYAHHDLLGAYATELADQDERRAALHRALDHYLHTAHAAARLLEPDRDPIRLDPPQPGVTAEPLTGYQQAMTWFTTERRVLLAAGARAAAAGFDRHAWQLPWALAGFLDLAGHWQDMAAVQTTALAAATRLDDRHSQIRIHHSAARAYDRLNRFDHAHTHLQHAVALAEQLGDQTIEAHTRMNLGALLASQGRDREALSHHRHALELYRVAGHQGGEIRTLNSIGWSHAMLGEHAAALDHCQRALAQAVELGDRYLQGPAWDSIGFAHHQLGDRHRAADCYQRALALHRETGDRYSETVTLTHLGDNHRALGDLAAARAAWRQALTILDQLGHSDAGGVRERLGIGRTGG